MLVDRVEEVEVEEGLLEGVEGGEGLGKVVWRVGDDIGVGDMSFGIGRVDGGELRDRERGKVGEVAGELLSKWES